MSLMTWVSWLTHSSGSLWMSSWSSTTMPPTKITTLATASGTASLDGSAPSHTTSLARVPWLKSRPLVGERNSRMPRMAMGSDAAHADGGDAHGQQQAEVADHRHLGEAQGQEGEDGVEGDDQQGGTEVDRGLLDRVLAWSMTTSSSMRECIWIA